MVREGDEKIEDGRSIRKPRVLTQRPDGRDGLYYRKAHDIWGRERNLLICRWRRIGSLHHHRLLILSVAAATLIYNLAFGSHVELLHTITLCH